MPTVAIQDSSEVLLQFLDLWSLLALAILFSTKFIPIYNYKVGK